MLPSFFPEIGHTPSGYGSPTIFPAGCAAAGASGFAGFSGWAWTALNRTLPANRTTQAGQSFMVFPSG
jgi:hypothetical protein